MDDTILYSKGFYVSSIFTKCIYVYEKHTLNIITISIFIVTTKYTIQKIN